MPDSIQCATHGTSGKTFVCTHLLGETAGLGSNRNDRTNDNPFPDAWCDNCELIRATHEGWNDESQTLVKNLATLLGVLRACAHPQHANLSYA